MLSNLSFCVLVFRQNLLKRSKSSEGKVKVAQIHVKLREINFLAIFSDPCVTQMVRFLLKGTLVSGEISPNTPLSLIVHSLSPFHFVVYHLIPINLLKVNLLYTSHDSKL